MKSLLRLLDHPYFFWALLALPSAGMVAGLINSSTSAHALLHPTGEFSARFMIFAMMVTPLQMIFKRARWTVWLMRRRRALGVAAFVYAVAHTLFYIVDIGSLQKVLGQFFALGIWTGWLALAVMIPLAITSNNRMQSKLGTWWKPLQRWVYLAGIMTLLHWIFIHNAFAGALAHFVPLALLQGYRLVSMYSSRNSEIAR